MNDEIVDGPYEHQDNIGNDGDVWTSTIFSDVATFLLTCSPGEDGESLPQQVLTKLSLAVTEVAIFDPNPTIADGRDLQTKCSFWDACIKDYMCCKDGSNGDCSGSFLTDDNVVSDQDNVFKLAHLEDLSNSHATIMWVSGGSWGACSAGLINNNGPDSPRPLFLTANHCITTSDSTWKLTLATLTTLVILLAASGEKG